MFEVGRRYKTKHLKSTFLIKHVGHTLSFAEDDEGNETVLGNSMFNEMEEVKEKKKKGIWIVVNKNGHTLSFDYWYNAQRYASNLKGSALVRVEFEYYEGQGLEEGRK